MKKSVFKSKKFIITAILLLVIGGPCALIKNKRARTEELRIKSMVEIKPQRGSFITKTQAIATVEPENRVLVMPSVSGRAEEVFFKEGMKVSKGQLLGKISSSERTALLDSLKTSQSSENEKRMIEEAYNLTPVVSPIDGTVVKRAVEPGQSVSPSKEIAVISDRLIIKTFVDETDIGKIKEGQEAEYFLDAFPAEKKKGRVISIAHESTTRENVNVYEVKVLPLSDTDRLRSGMTADMRIVTGLKDKALYLPKKAVKYRSTDSFVNIKKNGKLSEQKVETGASNESQIEIISGIDEKTSVYYSTGIASERGFEINIGGK
ncbi:MAG: efflux RND transporter periplasmic adaptor subunit [Elusimicrobiota bacterium]